MALTLLRKVGSGEEQINRNVIEKPMNFENTGRVSNLMLVYGRKYEEVELCLFHGEP